MLSKKDIAVIRACLEGMRVFEHDEGFKEDVEKTLMNFDNSVKELKTIGLIKD